MTGGENESETGDWHAAMESTIGLMGEKSNSGVVCMFVVMEGTGKGMCCGQVGLKGPRFCSTAPRD